MMSVEEIKKIDEPVLLIRINKLYREGMSSDQLYEATRKHWKLGSRVYGVNLVCSLYKGVVKEVYAVDKWFVSTGANEGRKHF